MSQMDDAQHDARIFNLALLEGGIETVLPQGRIVTTVATTGRIKGGPHIISADFFVCGTRTSISVMSGEKLVREITFYGRMDESYLQNQGNLMKEYVLRWHSLNEASTEVAE